MTTAELHYKIDWRASGHYPGHHASMQKGGGLQFRNHAALINAPDPRRFDVHASLRDPFEQVQVRVYRQTSAIPVYVIADLSASMSFVGASAKMHVMADFVAGLSDSATRTGDRFGFVGCAEATSDEWLLPATMNRAAGAELAERLRAYQPRGLSSQALLSAADSLGGRRALVFLVSDFHFPAPLLAQVLSALAYHDVVPVMLWDRHEHERLPRFGLVRVFDHETHGSRLLLMRPGLRRRIQERFAVQRKQLFDVFAQHGRLPLLMEDGFDADEVTRYFFG
jgi:hypothetical protein